MSVDVCEGPIEGLALDVTEPVAFVVDNKQELGDRVRYRPREYRSWKPIFDWVLAAVLLVWSAPLLGLVLILVRLTSRGPAIYRQTRLGLGGRPYTMYKVRSMVHDCEKTTGPRWATRRDPRVTPFGQFLRLTHLDELPQLWNVLRGEMSLVGPRPERPEIVADLERTIPRYRQRMEVRPGVTGLAQVQLPPDEDYQSVERKLECDLHYIGAITPWLDLRIMIGTALGALGLPFTLYGPVLRLPNLKTIRKLRQRIVRPSPVAEPAPAA